MEEIDLEKLEQEMENNVDLNQNLKDKLYEAAEAHNEALEHSYEMSQQMAHNKMVYTQNSNTDGPEYWELYTKFRTAEAAYTAAKEAEKVAEEALHAAEAEYYKNLKCTFCGGLDSICGGDHSEEMYWLSQPRYS
jgi:hypothetical protein